MTRQELTSSWVVDYSAARARAIRWLGDRYLLARPINAGPGGAHPRVAAPRDGVSSPLDSAALSLPGPGAL